MLHHSCIILAKMANPLCLNIRCTLPNHCCHGSLYHHRLRNSSIQLIRKEFPPTPTPPQFGLQVQSCQGQGVIRALGQPVFWFARHPQVGIIQQLNTLFPYKLSNALLHFHNCSVSLGFDIVAQCRDLPGPVLAFNGRMLISSGGIFQSVPQVYCLPGVRVSLHRVMV